MAINYQLSQEAKSHLLSHFNNNMPGSYFDIEVLPNPESVLSYLSDKTTNQIIVQANGTEVHMYNFDIEIGFDGIEHLSKINPLDINKFGRNGHVINYGLIKQKLTRTSQLCIVAKKLNQSYEVLTMFPGKYAPPTPNVNQSPQFYLECKDFWDKHLLIKSIV
jgi:hypothetical protein